MMSVFRNIKENTREISQHKIEYLKTTYIFVQQFFTVLKWIIYVNVWIFEESFRRELQAKH